MATVNYRIGPPGCLHLPGIGADNPGLLDRTAALRWVATNLAAFGGDPTLVTVAGQSSGAYGALLPALSPEGGPPVRRVIAQSAPLSLPLQDPEQAAATAVSHLRLLGRRAVSGEQLGRHGRGAGTQGRRARPTEEDRGPRGEERGRRTGPETTEGRFPLPWKPALICDVKRRDDRI
ncbi:carboxylesterase family protein [Streptomyces sp. NPDC048650]|uniref:carboxylesterase family protein n=1 Tax=Streptomyces sp. NPDC048650 TaxID=3365583 RepID=UPI003718AA8A